MSISSRIEETIERWSEQWKERLHAWMVSWLGGGIELIMDIVGRGMGNRLDSIIDVVAAKWDIPPETVQEMKDIWKGEGEWQALLGGTAGGTAVGSIVGSTIGPFLKLLEYQGLRAADSFRLDPYSVITAWRRDPDTYDQLFQDLKDQGWSDERIEALKFITRFMPTAQDLVNWQAKEVFEPEMITKYGLDDEFGGLDLTLFEKIGVTQDQALNYWRAHWEHASWMQVIEMLHRGLLKEEDVRDWFRLVEIPPYWRQLLIDTAYTWPTRVDVRRWWDMRTIDETELRRLYSGMGYRGVNLDNYVLWTKVYTEFPSLMARWTKGWITEDDVRRELTALGMPASRVETMLQEKIKPEEAARVEEGKALTKTEIYKGVKQGFITRDQGAELIMDLGYSRAEAEYLMDINVAVLEGSPETFEEFKDLTTKYREARGMTEKPVPEELKAAADELVRVKLEVDALERAVAGESRLHIPDEGVPPAAVKKLKELQVALNRARAELERVQLNYNSLVARWKHTLE